MRGRLSSSAPCLRLAPLVFVRPGELRYAEWSEIDFEGSEWRIAAERMKMKARHIVPLPRQALAILQELHPFTGHGRYLFPGAAHRCAISQLRTTRFPEFRAT